MTSFCECSLHDGQHPKTRRLFCPTRQARLAKIFLFPNTSIYGLTKSTRPLEGRFAIVTIRGQGCGGRGVSPGVRHVAYGQAVWS
jgi:hypothetical protein